MSRLDNLGEILDGYEWREYESESYFPSKECVEKMRKSLAQYFGMVEMAYLATKDGEYFGLIAPNELSSADFENIMQNAINDIKTANLDFSGVVFYSAEKDALDFITDEDPKAKKCVPDGVEMPELLLVLDQKGKYVFYKGEDLYDEVGLMPMKYQK